MGDLVGAAHWPRTSNDELVARCQCGDAGAWNELVGRYRRLVYSVAIRNGLSPDDAADVTQSTFAALVDQIARLDAPDGLGGWLSTVARRQSWRLRQSREVEVALAVGHDAEAAPDPELDDTRWLERQLALLPAPCGALLTALFFEQSEPSYAELAVRMGRPVGSIGPTRARCLERLRRALESAAGPAA